MTADLTPPLATAAPDATALGLGHFLAQSDAVGLTLLGLLVAMSVSSWAIIVIKAVSQYVGRRRSRRFLSFFWNARSLDEVAAGLQSQGVSEPFGHLTAQALQARAHHAQHGGTRLEDAGSAQDLVTRTLKKVLDEETTRLESGLTPLATVGATAPFVGLFGTVWGVYHALIGIGAMGTGGAGGAAGLDQVAGPVGEALIMTGIGLAVAIPAVMAYNAFTRHNRLLDGRLDAFAFELQTFLSTGAPLGSGDAQRPPLRAVA
jgi:biopolymer transport protein ExbB